MRRLSSLDNSFLQVETPSAHMHVGWHATLELPPGVTELDPDTLAERIAARLHLAPRFRQRVAPAPLGEPLWADDPAFKLDRHLVVERLAAAPTTLGAAERAVGELADDFFSRQLDRSRPLWELAVVPAAGRGRAAVLGKVHHAMVDGLAAVELGTLLFDLAPNSALPDPADWDPEPADGALRLAVDAVAESALEQFRNARRMTSLGLQPRRGLRVAETMRRAALSMAEDVIRPAPPSFLNREIGPRRSLVTGRMPLSRLERIKRERGVKLNDVVLAVVAGALRRFALAVDEEPRPLRAMVPVSVRGAADSQADGNRITFAFIELPVPEPEASRRLALVHAQTQELKASPRIAGSDALLRSMVQLPGFVKERAARLAASPRMFNLTVSNVPGPRVPLYAAGAKVESIHPVIPITDGHALAIGVLTYRDAMHFAAYVDPDALPDAPELAPLLRNAVTELDHAVTRSRRTPLGSKGGAPGTRNERRRPSLKGFAAHGRPKASKVPSDDGR